MDTYSRAAARRGGLGSPTILLAGALLAIVGPGPSWGQTPPEEQERFVGGLVEDREAVGERPLPVRNDLPRPKREIVALRYFKIDKGSFDRFFAASRDGVWPYFEKIGARVIGQWRVVHPEADDAEPVDYEEVYMLTRYASFEHWQATRSMARLGGNGPDWEKCREAIEFRRTLTRETWVRFLEGQMAPGGPYFLPGLEEEYALVGDGP